MFIHRGEVELMSLNWFKTNKTREHGFIPLFFTGIFMSV